MYKRLENARVGCQDTRCTLPPGSPTAARRKPVDDQPPDCRRGRYVATWWAAEYHAGMVGDAAIRTGDKVTWDAPQFSGGSFFRGRCKGAKCIGTLRLSGIVERHSYGVDKGQHTFSIRLVDGTLKRVKGRNLYPNLVEHVPSPDSPDRCDAGRTLLR